MVNLCSVQFSTKMWQNWELWGNFQIGNRQDMGRWCNQLGLITPRKWKLTVRGQLFPRKIFMMYIHIFKMHIIYIYTGVCKKITLTIEFDLHDQKSIGYLPFLVRRLHIHVLSFTLITCQIAEMKFLFLVTMTSDLHDQTSIEFFLSLWVSHIPSLELIAWFLLDLWCGNNPIILSRVTLQKQNFYFQ